jgi:predicted Rossmann fold nucleotide-binding protein DprA/Smf involved in DNA uptake
MDIKEKGQQPTDRNPNHNKDKHFKNQMQVIFKAFHKRPATMLMIALETGILRANICRYVAEWEKQGNIQVVKKGYCVFTKHIAGYYTTNKELFKEDNQLKLFV